MSGEQAMENAQEAARALVRAIRNADMTTLDGLRLLMESVMVDLVRGSDDVDGLQVFAVTGSDAIREWQVGCGGPVAFILDGMTLEVAKHALSRVAMVSMSPDEAARRAFDTARALIDLCSGEPDSSETIAVD